MQNIDFITQLQSASFSNAVQSIVGRMCIVDFGVIKKVLGKGVVQVLISASKDSTDMRVINCPLIVPSASALMVDIIPAVGDKVLVVSPRRYNNEMFKKEKDETIVNENSAGYSVFTSLAILANQFRTADYKNILTVDNGTVSAKLGYVANESDDSKSYNSLVLNTNADGSISADIKKAKSDGTPYSSMTTSINADGALSYEIKDNSDKSVNKISIGSDGSASMQTQNTKLSLGSDNAITIDTSKAKVTIDSSGNVTIDAMSGKLSLKNTATSLYTILNGILNILNTSLQTAGSPASHTVVPSQFQTQATQLGQLMQ